MFDDFFFPYEKAKLWTRDMVISSLSNFFLYISLYIMLPVLPLWMVQHWYCSYAEAGGAVAVFGLTMFLPGPCNSYIIDTYKRKSVCVITMALLAGVSLLYPYVATVGLVALLRMVQGALFSVVTMTTGSTLVIDVTAYYPSLQKQFKIGYRVMDHPENFEFINDSNIEFKRKGDKKARQPFKIIENANTGQIKQPQ